MNRCTTALALATAAWITFTAAAAPAPEPPSQGPISDALALRSLVPTTPAPTANVAVSTEKEIVQMESLVAIPVFREVVDTITLPNGQTEQIKRAVSSVQYETRTIQVKADGIKFFTVGKDGKLEVVEPGKAMEQLQKRTPVLTGDSAEVDPRNLALVKAGTLYLVLPPTPSEIFAPPGRPLQVPPEAIKKRD
jgi:hypothetical protein